MNMTYPMSAEDRSIQAAARAFVDEELIPHEVEAEMNAGVLSPRPRSRRARAAGWVSSGSPI
jgi:hypothetical protein